MSYRQDLFPKILVPAEFAAFRASYEGINPDRPLAPAGISFRETDPLLRSLVHEAPGLNSFSDEFLLQLGTSLHGPFPLPGSQVTRSAWDCRGKAGAYRACGISAESVKGKLINDLRFLEANRYLFRRCASELDRLYKGVQPSWGASFWLEKL